VKNGAGANGEAVTSEQSGKVELARSPESYTYDADGNMLSDGWWSYTWDGENRLTSMTALASVPATGKRKLEFAYDYMGRRVQKKVYSWNVGTSAYQLSSTVKFIYDGWNVVAEIDGNNALIRSYVWGQDLSGSMQGAGGIGGLLLVNEGGSSYQVGYDGNGNVVGLMKAGVGTFSATYEYDPFGNTLRSTGEYATQNPFRFSTKYVDNETGLVYYGYRYCNPQTGKWISRDPSEEAGGLNLYTFIGNDGINSVDFLGLWRRGRWSGSRGKYSGIVIATKDCDSLTLLARLITGIDGDWTVLNAPKDIKRGQIVNIAPLLNVFEARLRSNIVNATKKLNSKFGNEEIHIIENESLEDSVNAYFGESEFGSLGCDSASEYVQLKGLIDTLRTRELDKLGLSRNDLISRTHVDSIESMLPGDKAWIRNYPEYVSAEKGIGPWQAENVIFMGKDRWKTSRYWGHGGTPPVKTLDGWENTLRAEYNLKYGVTRVPSDPIPGFDGELVFLNVPKITMRLFDIRNKAMR
jgi:RHS repeat-associated protein